VSPDGVARVGVVLLALFAPPVGAAAPPSGGRPGPDLFAGYSYTSAGEAGLHGWQVDGSYPLGTSLRLVADVSGHYGSFAQADLTQLTFMAGGRWVWREGRFTPFAEALVGGARTKTSVALRSGEIADADTDWGPAFGGGLDYRFAERWSARAQVDVLVLRAEGAWETDPRLSLGVVYRLE
jgi:opacity protein-like surface antigen